MSADLLRRAASDMRRDSVHMAGLGDEQSIFTLAVADWLDQFAVYEDTGENAEDERACAVGVARAYLGESE